MRIQLTIVSLILLLTPALRAQQIRIGVIGDQTLAPQTGNQYDVLKKGVEVLNSEKPDTVLHTGDLLESVGPDFGPTKPDVYTNMYQQATGILNTLPSKWYISAGDHDVNPPFGTNDQTVRKLFQSLYKPASEQLYYSFDVKGYHFIALSSQEADAPGADPRWGVIFRSHLSQAQIDWLKRDLHQHPYSTGTVVFLHQPLWYQWADWAPVHDLLRKNNVIAVIAGHFHYNQDEGQLDGIRYLVVGATGGKTKIGSSNAGNLQHVTMMHVVGRRIERLQLLPLQGESTHSFSSRRDMDRIQALEVNLGNYWNDTSENANRVEQNGSQWKSCTNNTNGTLTLHSIGNPLDIPITLEVVANQGNFPPTSAHFNPKLCNGSDGERCRLAPGALVDFSNNSSVQPSYRSCHGVVCSFGEPQALWTAQFPDHTSDGNPISQTFTVKASFQGDSGQQLEVDTVFPLTTGCDIQCECKPHK